MPRYPITGYILAAGFGRDREHSGRQATPPNRNAPSIDRRLGRANRHCRRRRSAQLRPVWIADGVRQTPAIPSLQYPRPLKPLLTARKRFEQIVNSLGSGGATIVVSQLQKDAAPPIAPQRSKIHLRGTANSGPACIKMEQR